MEDNEQQTTSSAPLIDKAIVKDALSEVLSELPALKNLLEKEPGLLPGANGRGKEIANADDKDKDEAKDKNPQRKYRWLYDYRLLSS